MENRRRSEEIAEDEVGNLRRFVELGTEPDQTEYSHQNGIFHSVKSFFEGELAQNRMAQIRQFIYEIRNRWDSEYFQYSANLCLSLGETWDKILQKPRNWVDISQESADNFAIIQLYTTDNGYRSIFNQMNVVFRSSAASDIEIRNAVFLVELINIDLFNYIRYKPTTKNFEGLVYRGMAVKKEDLQTYFDFMCQPISQRFITVPLSLQSSSLDKRVAMAFIRRECRRCIELFPVLMIIHVIGLPESRLRLYQDQFPASVVSSICAVDISGVSAIGGEAEVLLRGAFYQVMGMSQIEDEKLAQPLTVIEMVSVNANRDHISNPCFLGSDDAAARKLFGALVSLTRNEFIVQHGKENPQSVMDLADYEEAIQKDTLMLKNIAAFK